MTAMQPATIENPFAPVREQPDAVERAVGWIGGRHDLRDQLLHDLRSASARRW